MKKFLAPLLFAAAVFEPPPPPLKSLLAPQVEVKDSEITVTKEADGRYRATVVVENCKISQTGQSERSAKISLRVNLPPRELLIGKCK